MHSPLLIAFTVLATLGQIKALPSSPKYAPTAHVAKVRSSSSTLAPNPKANAAHTQKFEDAGFSAASEIVPVNVYQEILYNGFSGIGSATGFKVTGIVPQSPNNEIAYGLTDIPTIQQGDPEMTTVYQNSNVTFFDLTSFFYGCSADVLLPLGCKITATCVDPAGQVVASDIFDFDGNGGRAAADEGGEAQGVCGVSER